MVSRGLAVYPFAKTHAHRRGHGKLFFSLSSPPLHQQHSVPRAKKISFLFYFLGKTNISATRPLKRRHLSSPPASPNPLHLRNDNNPSSFTQLILEFSKNNPTAVLTEVADQLCMKFKSDFPNVQLLLRRTIQWCKEGDKSKKATAAATARSAHSLPLHSSSVISSLSTPKRV